MAAPVQRLVFEERKSFSRSVFSDDEELKCLSDDSDILEEFVHPHARTRAFATRKKHRQKQSEKQKSIEIPQELVAPANPASTFVTKSGRPSWADLHDDSNDSEEQLEENFGEHVAGYATDQSDDAWIPAHSTTWQTLPPAPCKGTKECSVARAPSPRTMRQVPVKPNAVELPFLLWDPIGNSQEKIELPSTHYVSKLAEGRPSDKGNCAMNFEKWSWSTTASSTAAEFEELLEEMPPSLSPSMQMPSVRQQPPMANPGASQQTPTATEISPCLGFGVVPVAMAFPVIQMPYPAARTTNMWWNCEAPQQALQQACFRPVPPVQVQFREDAAEESRPRLTTTGRSLSHGVAMRGPCFGGLHRFHHSMASMGVLSADLRSFTKTQNKNRLSIVCEDKVHGHGVTRYAVQFTNGELSNADGVGFILSSEVPCTKNIQKIVSLFVNRTGRICVRMKQEVERISARVKAIELGDWLEVVTDLEQRKLTFIVWPQDKSAPSSVTVGLGKLMDKAAQRWPSGYLAVVVKHIGVSVALAS